jgi:tetratricopeptide (TPR) repeat protein
MNARQDREAREARQARRPPRLAFLALALALAAPARVHAQDSKPSPSEQKQQFREHYEKGKRFFDLLKYSEAAEEYEKAYLAAPDPVMLFNIAQCHRLNDQPDEAIRFYKSYLRNAPSAVNRADVEKRIAEMEKLSEERHKQGSAPVVAPGPGPVVAPPATGTATPGPTAPPVTEPPPPPPLAVKPPTPTTPIGVSATAPPPAPSRMLPKVLLVGGGVLIATSVITGLVAISKSKQVQDAANEKTRSFDDSLQSAEKTGKAANGAAIVTGLAGLAVGAVGVILWIRSAPSGPEVAGAPPPPALYPVAGPGFAGAGARFAF